MQYLFTERAHLMCPQMNFGIVLASGHPYDAARIRNTLEQLSAAHPFLKAVLGYEKDRNAYYYRVTDSAKTELLPEDRMITGTDDPEVMKEYHLLTSRDWDLFSEGMLQVAAWPVESGTCFLLVFHHLLADGRGALGLAQELAECYESGKQPKPAEERLISSVKDFPADSGLPLISRFLINRANKIQAKEHQVVTYEEYHAFAGEFLRRNPVSHNVKRVSREELEGILRQCRAHEVTVNDWLLAKMMTEEHTARVIMACDLRSRLACYCEGALGNYSTAFSVEVRKKEQDLFRLAKALHEQVQQKLKKPSGLYLVLQCYANLDPAVLDAACIACRGGYPGKAGKFVGSMFFGFDKSSGYSVTNLGKIESESITSAYFIPPASPAIRKTQGVLTVNGVMTVCSSERPEATGKTSTAVPIPTR